MPLLVTARTQPLLIIEGVLQKKDGIINIIAERLAPLRQDKETAIVPGARNFA